MPDLFQPFRHLPGYRQLGEDRFISTCPVHSEKTPSFRGVMRGNKLLLTCHGCHASIQAIMVAVGLTFADLFLDARRPAHELRKTHSEAARFAQWRETELKAASLALRERDALLSLDWSPFINLGGEDEPWSGGELLWDTLATAYAGYNELEWRWETLWRGERQELMALWEGKPIEPHSGEGDPARVRTEVFQSPSAESRD